MTNVICLCGAEAPIVIITEQEPDEEIREEFFGKKLVRCEACHTLTLVDEELQEQLDAAEEIGRREGCEPPLVRIVDAKEEADRKAKKIKVEDNGKGILKLSKK
jgi:DNA topoisomerase VI subunit B